MQNDQNLSDLYVLAIRESALMFYERSGYCEQLQTGRVDYWTTDFPVIASDDKLSTNSGIFWIQITGGKFNRNKLLQHS